MSAPTFCPTGTWATYTWATYVAAGGGTGTGPTYSHSSPNIECLPNNGAGFASSAVGSTGNLTTGSGSALDAWITQLLTTAGAVPPTVNPTTSSLTSSTPTAPGASAQTPTYLADTFATNAANLRTSLVTEYCFYQAAYVFALGKLLLAAANIPDSGAGTTIILHTDGTIASTSTVYSSGAVNIKYGSITVSESTTSASGLMGDVYTLNNKLNQIIQMIQELQTVRWNTLNTSYYGVFSDPNSTLNTPLSTVQNNLQTVSNTLTNGDFEMSAKQTMIEYTMEKNSSSRNLLAVYGFMNIVAVGLLFYMYKAAK